MLARLEQLPTLAEARVDASGRFFLCGLAPGAPVAEATDDARRTLGAAARVLGAAEAEAQLAGRARGDPWLAAHEVMTLSYVESRILSVRLAAQVQRETGATAEQREVVAEAVRAALFAAVERVHAEGGRQSSGWIYEEWPAIAHDAAGRCRDAMPAERHRAVEALLPRLLAR